MPIRIAVVGPGRVGQALGRRWREAGLCLLGFVGRTRASAERAIAFAGGGDVLALADLARAHVVAFAVGDPELPLAVAEAVAAREPRSCSLWLHTSARHGLEVFAPLERRGVRIGSLHPVAPFADAERGYASLRGKPALLVADPRGKRLLRGLCERLPMQPVWARSGGDRAAYHAACALAANGLTALRADVDLAFRGSGVVDDADADRIADALMTAALDGCRAHGAERALSGPVLRGDAETVTAHRRALARGAPVTEATYRELMRSALRLAVARGLPPDRVAAVLRALDEGGR